MLQALDRARRRLAAVVQERSRVLDLICAALPSTNLSSSASLSGTRNYGNYSYSNTGRYSRMSAMEGSGSPIVDPLGAFTPEAEQALLEAREARQRSAMLRKELSDSINRSGKMQKAAHKSVNDGLTQKIAETVSLKVRSFAVLQSVITLPPLIKKIDDWKTTLCFRKKKKSFTFQNLQYGLSPPPHKVFHLYDPWVI